MISEQRKKYSENLHKQKGYKMKHPRICSYYVRNARGGFFDFQPRNPLVPNQRVDTVPKHAAKPDEELIGRDGVVLPIVNVRRSK